MNDYRFKLFRPGLTIFQLSMTSVIMPPRSLFSVIMPPSQGEGALSDDARLTADVCLSVAYIGPKSRTQRLRKTKIATEVAHLTRDSDTTFKKGQLTGARAYCGGLPRSLFSCECRSFGVAHNTVRMCSLFTVQMYSTEDATEVGAPSLVAERRRYQYKKLLMRAIADVCTACVMFICLIFIVFLHCALSLAAQCIVIGPVSVCLCVCLCVCLWDATTITRNCMHLSSPNWVCRRR